jgi:hypothetical protein
MILESSAAEATRRLSDSGVTVCKVAPISRAPTKQGSKSYGVRIDSEDVFIEGGVNADDVAHLVIDLQFQRRHGAIKMNAVEIVHE